MKWINLTGFYIFVCHFCRTDVDSSDEDWTEEEIDKVFMWYAELDGCPDMVDKIKVMFSEIGIKKSKLEVCWKLTAGNHWKYPSWTQNVNF